MGMMDRLDPDVITLDVAMPGIDGMETLRRIRERNSGARVIMLSTVTKRGAPETMQALELGASDYCAKPELVRSAGESLHALRRELIPKLRQFAKPMISSMRTPAALGTSVNPANPVARGGPQALLIGISTGGPQVLSKIIPTMPADYPLPILIVQHMPALFTALLAQRLNAESKIEVEEATAGQTLRPGLALIAPAGITSG